MRLLIALLALLVLAGCKKHDKPQVWTEAGVTFPTEGVAPFQVVSFDNHELRILVECPWPGHIGNKPWKMDASNLKGCKMGKGVTLDELIQGMVRLQEEQQEIMHPEEK